MLHYLCKINIENTELFKDGDDLQRNFYCNYLRSFAIILDDTFGKWKTNIINFEIICDVNANYLRNVSIDSFEQVNSCNEWHGASILQEKNNFSVNGRKRMQYLLDSLASFKTVDWSCKFCLIFFQVCNQSLVSRFFHNQISDVGKAFKSWCLWESKSLKILSKNWHS